MADIVGAGIIGNFYGDGSDGVLDLSVHPAQQITAPNGGNPALLTDGNLGTFFVTNSIANGSVLYSIDFGQDVALTSITLKSASCGAGSGNVGTQYSLDGVIWITLSSGAMTTTPTDITISGNQKIARYWRITNNTVGTTTFSIAESQVTFSTTTAYFPATAHTGVALKNYTSINIPAGITVSVDNPCRGIVLYCQGNVNIAGTLHNNGGIGGAGFGTDNIAPMIIGKVKSDLTTPELTKYFQLTTVLQALKGGAGGNGGGGGWAGNGVGNGGGNGGTGGAGRINAGGYGAGGGGGGNTTSGSKGGNGGSIAYPELGGGLGGKFFSPVNIGHNGCNGGGGSSGGAGGSNSGAGGDAISGGSGAGGGGGNFGDVGGNSPSFTGGLVLIICGGNVTNSGTISANGSNGAIGGNGCQTATTSGTWGGGGGGGGGGAGGGVIGIFYGGTYTNTGSVSVAGGSGGAGGLAGLGQTYNGVAGVAGTAGSVGTIVTQKIA